MTTESCVRFFGFSLVPFTKEVEDTDLWLPPSKEEIVDQICEAVQEHSQVMLTGEPGAGKTCTGGASSFATSRLSAYLLSQRHPRQARLLSSALLALGLTPAATAAAVFYAVSTHFEYLGRERIHPILLLDEFSD